MSHAGRRGDAAGNPLRESLDELARLADSLVDGLSDDESDAPAEAAPAAEPAAAADAGPAARSGLSESLEEIDRFGTPEPPLRSGEPVLEGDRGEDIDAFLDSVLASDEPAPLETAEQDKAAGLFDAPATPVTEAVVEVPLAAEAAELPAAPVESPPDPADDVESTSGVSDPSDPSDPPVDDAPPAYSEPPIELGSGTGFGAGWWIAIACVVLLVAIGAWFALGAGARRAEATTSAPDPAPRAARSEPAIAPIVVEPVAPLEAAVELPAEPSAAEVADTPEPEPLAEPAPPAEEPATDVATAVVTPRPRPTFTPPPPPPPTTRDAEPESATVEPAAADVQPVPPAAPAIVEVEVAEEPAPDPISFTPGPDAEAETPLRLTVAGRREGAAPSLAGHEPAEAEIAPPEPAEPAEPAVAAPTVVEAPYRPPVVVERREPDYPPRALRRGVEGEVVLRVLVSETGSVVRVVVDDGPDPELEAAAIEAVLHWRYRPARDGGRAVRGWVTETFAFAPGGGA